MGMPNVDQGALELARYIHRIAEASQTFLFGSRARGDYREHSDIDLLVITEPKLEDEKLDDIMQRARHIQKERMPEASGIDVIFMSEPEFKNRVKLRNNLANAIAKEGLPVLPDDDGHWRVDHEVETVDWDDVDRKLGDADGAASWLNAVRDAGILDLGMDRQLGIIAHDALESGYKAAIGAHGHEYPASGRVGHNLTRLAELLREHRMIGRNEQAPGEDHCYLSAFGGDAAYAHEHPPLDRRRIAREVPDAVARLRDLVAKARS